MWSAHKPSKKSVNKNLANGIPIKISKCADNTPNVTAQYKCTILVISHYIRLPHNHLPFNSALHFHRLLYLNLHLHPQPHFYLHIPFSIKLYNWILGYKCVVILDYLMGAAKTRLGKKHFFVNSDILGIPIWRKKRVNYKKFKLRQDSINQLFNPNAFFLFLLTGATQYYHAIQIVFTHFASFTSY